MGELLKQYLWIFNLVALLVASFFSAKIVGVYLAQKLELDRSIAIFSQPAQNEDFVREKKEQEEYKVIVDRNIFDSVEQVVKSEDRDSLIQDELIPTGEAVPTSLSLNVLGVLVVGEGRDGRSSATIAGSGSTESFAPNTTLVRVAPDRIEFVHNGRLEYAEVGGKFGESIFAPPKRSETVASIPHENQKAVTPQAGVKQEVPGNYVVDQKEIDQALQNLDQLYTEIRAVPNFSGGKVSGIKILNVKTGSIFDKLGIKRGDILVKVNGVELDAKQGLTIFNQLKDTKTFNLDLLRHGQAQTFEYEIR